MSRIAVVGVGQMGRSAISILASSDVDMSFIAIDRETSSLEATRAIGEVVERTEQVDLFHDTLDFSSVDLVLNFAGPFFRGSDIVARAALAAQVPYIDVGDDVEATQAVLALHTDAVRAGVPVVTGAGLSPGVSNWLAAQILAAKPDCTEIKIVWSTHEPDPGGLAPLRHMLHMAVSPCPVWADGRMSTSPGFVPATSEVFDFPAPFGRIQAQDTSHPEPFTLSRQFPQLRDISCKGSLRPEWANAAFSTLGRIGFGYHDETIRYGDLEIEPAEFLWRLMWQRHGRRPARTKDTATAIMVIGLHEGRILQSRTIFDAGDMSRGTGLGAAAAALCLLRQSPAPGAGGVEMLDADEGIATFLRLAHGRDAFTKGVIISD